jgi:hypothetical protein
MIDDITPANLPIRDDDNLVKTPRSRGENLDFFDDSASPPSFDGFKRFENDHLIRLSATEDHSHRQKTA